MPQNFLTRFARDPSAIQSAARLARLVSDHTSKLLKTPLTNESFSFNTDTKVSKYAEGLEQHGKRISSNASDWKLQELHNTTPHPT